VQYTTRDPMVSEPHLEGFKNPIMAKVIVKIAVQIENQMRS
jgi:hypothetical protein